MFDHPATILHMNPEPGRRILVISDIHGNLPYLKGLLEQLQFSPDDILILNGDLLEKGPFSLDTLHFAMELCRGGNTIAVAGNCDLWGEMLKFRPEGLGHTLKYIQNKKSGILWDMALGCGLNPEENLDMLAFRSTLMESYGPEMHFLCHLPHAVETPHFIFAHAAVLPGKPLEEHRVSELVRCDAFRRLGYSFDKWVIVGHYPVVLYGENRVDANPVIDREHHIISIDGGCVLKDDGQLNALIIPEDGSEDFRTEYYTPFPRAQVRDSQAESSRSYYIRWGDSRVQVLYRGEEFSRCRHVRTGYEMEILTKYLFSSEEITGCNDCTDYILPLQPGDRVEIIEQETSHGWFVKHHGVSGWYRGRLQMI